MRFNRVRRSKRHPSLKRSLSYFARLTFFHFKRAPGRVLCFRTLLAQSAVLAILYVWLIQVWPAKT